MTNSQDMRRFREMTMNGTVICGKRTFESFPNGPLPGRFNIVVTHDVGNPLMALPDMAVARDIVEAVSIARDKAFGNGKIWVIGGESIYRQMIPLCDSAYVTRHDTLIEADSFFPNLDEDPRWRVVEHQGGGITSAGVEFEFIRYGRTYLRN